MSLELRAEVGLRDLNLGVISNEHMMGFKTLRQGEKKSDQGTESCDIPSVSGWDKQEESGSGGQEGRLRRWEAIQEGTVLGGRGEGVSRKE